jgi:hypothetical protein
MWFKMIASAMSVNPVPDFFEPIRRTVITNLLGYFPVLDEQGAVTSIAASSVDDDVRIDDILSDLPIVTYVSRQGGAWRRLGDEYHEGLVQALNDLEREGVCKVNVARLETMDLKEQVALVARSTVSPLLSQTAHVLVISEQDIAWCSWEWADGNLEPNIYCGSHITYVRFSINYGCRPRRDPPLWKSLYQMARFPTPIRVRDLNTISAGFLFDYEILARSLGHKVCCIRSLTLNIALIELNYNSIILCGTTHSRRTRRGHTTRFARFQLAVYMH